jgi:hypothetical protein
MKSDAERQRAYHQRRLDQAHKLTLWIDRPTLAAIDQVRGDQPRAAFVRRAVAAFLDDVPAEREQRSPSLPVPPSPPSPAPASPSSQRRLPAGSPVAVLTYREFQELFTAFRQGGRSPKAAVAAAMAEAQKKGLSLALAQSYARRVREEK